MRLASMIPAPILFYSPVCVSLVPFLHLFFNIPPPPSITQRKNSQDLASAAGDSLEEDGLPGEEGGASSAFTHDNTTPSVTMTDADDDSIAVEIHPEQVSPSAAKKAVAAPSAMARVEGAVVSPRLPEAEAEVVAAEAAALLDDLHVPDSLESDQARIGAAREEGQNGFGCRGVGSLFRVAYFVETLFFNASPFMFS